MFSYLLSPACHMPTEWKELARRPQLTAESLASSVVADVEMCAVMLNDTAANCYAPPSCIKARPPHTGRLCGAFCGAFRLHLAHSNLLRNSHINPYMCFFQIICQLETHVVIFILT